ncbi:MAG: hypothetical protein SO170_10825 [Butyribacter sp.]|nr:hypothetical protein [bacterium]MDY3855428.1 hypothetical protein [Butyribacter sp.]
MAIDWENYGRDRYTRENTQSSAYRENSYVEGNTVRKMSAVPKRREEVEPKRAPKEYPQRKPVRMPGISLKGFAFMTVLLGAVIFSCFSYLSTQNELRTKKAEVIRLQSVNEEQREENEEAYQAVMETVDLSEIYEKATKKLKMVQAESNQIYTYTNKKSDMVKQYADIPNTEK